MNARLHIAALSALALVGQGGPASAQLVEVPSGQPVHLQEVLIDTVETQTWLRFRFVAPAIAREGGSVDYAAAEPDMAHLCADFALRYIAEQALTVNRIAISLADRETEFGASDPEATQFIEVYRPDGGACIWEAF